jgi:hypothetical protein
MQYFDTNTARRRYKRTIIELSVKRKKKTQHENLEFGHTIPRVGFKKTCKKKVHEHSTGDETQKTHQFW